MFGWLLSRGLPRSDRGGANNVHRPFLPYFFLSTVGGFRRESDRRAQGRAGEGFIAFAILESPY